MTLHKEVRNERGLKSGNENRKRERERVAERGRGRWRNGDEKFVGKF